MEIIVKNNIVLLALIFSLNAASATEGYLVDRLNHCKIFTTDTTNRYATWTGPCLNGFANGYGITTLYENDKQYYVEEVNRLNGKEEGFGKVTFSNGTIYVGQFSNNLGAVPDNSKKGLLWVSCARAVSASINKIDC